MRLNIDTSIAKQVKFKTLEIGSYFQHESKIYIKMSNTKIREFSDNKDIIFRKNPDVLFVGYCLEHFIQF